MKKLQYLMYVALISCLLTSCSTPTAQTNPSLPPNDSSQKDMVSMKDVLPIVKEEYGPQDRDIQNINKLVFARWQQVSSSIMIIPLDDKGNWILDDAIGLSFAGPPSYDLYGKGNSKADVVEKFMEQINEKRSNNIVLKNFIQKDLIVTLEFADGSKVVFDGYYKEIEENLNKVREMIK